MRKLLGLLAALVVTSVNAATFIVPSFTLGATSNSTFTALHTYFLSASGNDNCNGTSPAAGSSGNCAWKTPNHAVVCGDVIIAAPGTYSSAFVTWGTVSNCPSTTGGIDEQGGVYFATLLCGGADLTSCPVLVSNSNGFDVNKSNWAVEGFSVTVGTAYEAMKADACSVSSTLHHVALVNNLIYGAGYGIDATHCGNSFGADYLGFVGNILDNANAWSGTCMYRGAALDINAPQALDTKPGTHILASGNFLIANIGPPCGGSDYEAIMVDTWNGFNYSQQGVISNNLVYHTAGFGMQVFGAGAATLKIYGNTIFDSSVNIPVAGEFNSSEINLVPGSNGPTLIVQANIARTNRATAAGGTPVYAMNVDSVTTSISPQPTVSSNTLWGTWTGCEGVCAPSSSQPIAISCCTSPEYVYGTNNYADPMFANTKDLLANWVGVPNCSGKISTDACMGWNISTGTAVILTPIADLTPTAPRTSGQGYQGAKSACAPNADYPVWLKGIVYLHWTGSEIVTNFGLITKPCGV